MLKTELIKSDKYYKHFVGIDPHAMDRNFLYKPAVFETFNYFQPLTNSLPRKKLVKKFVEPDKFPIETVVQRILNSKNAYSKKETLIEHEETVRLIVGYERDWEKPYEGYEGWDASEPFGGLGWSMNPQRIRDHVQKQFTELRKLGNLLTRSEFERMKNHKQFRAVGKAPKSGEIPRVWGANYLQNQFSKLEITNYKVPRFVVVIEDHVKKLPVALTYLSDTPLIESIDIRDGEVLVERIERASKTAQLKEHQWLRTLGYVDFGDPGNILTTAEATHFVVDTEPTALEGYQSIRKDSNGKLREYAKRRFKTFNSWSCKTIHVNCQRAFASASIKQADSIFEA